MYENIEKIFSPIPPNNYGKSNGVGGIYLIDTILLVQIFGAGMKRRWADDEVTAIPPPLETT